MRHLRNLGTLGAEIRVQYQNLPTVPQATELINLLTQLVEAGIVHGGAFEL